MNKKSIYLVIHKSMSNLPENLHLNIFTYCFDTISYTLHVYHINKKVIDMLPGYHFLHWHQPGNKTVIPQSHRELIHGQGTHGPQHSPGQQCHKWPKWPPMILVWLNWMSILHTCSNLVNRDLISVSWWHLFNPQGLKHKES